MDSALGGVWVALMEFGLLPGALLITMLSMDKLGWSARFLARTDAKSLQRLDALHTIGFLEKPFSLGQLKVMLGRWRSTLDRAEPT